jgi:hypothetical protein
MQRRKTKISLKNVDVQLIFVGEVLAVQIFFMSIFSHEKIWKPKV